MDSYDPIEKSVLFLQTLDTRDVTRPHCQTHEAEAETEATTHEAEAEATTHEAEVEATGHEAQAEAEAEAEAEAKTRLEILIIITVYLTNILINK